MPGPKPASKALQANNFALFNAHIVWVASIDGDKAQIQKTRSIGKNEATAKVASYGKPLSVYVSELIAI